MAISDTKLKLAFAGVLVASACGASFLRLAWATSGAGGASEVLSGAVLLGEIDTKGESDTHEIEIKASGVWEMRIIHFASNQTGTPAGTRTRDRSSSWSRLAH